jgi:hypothetical protein
MPVFDRQVAMVLRLIAKNGQDITYRVTDSTFDDTPWQGDAPTFTDYIIKGCFIPVDRVDRDTMVYREFSDIPIGFVTMYIGRVPFIPKLKDSVIREGKTLSVSRVQAYKPNSEVIAYVLELLE